MFNHLHKNITVLGAEISPLEYGLKAQHRGSLTIMEQLSLDFQEEIWKDIVGFEGLYQISNCGRIRSVSRYIDRKKFGIMLLKSRLLKTSINGAGYKISNFQKNYINKNVTIHRLVAIYFISNPENKPQINHIDGNKLNNHFINLEWCTAVENMKHAKESGLIKGMVPNINYKHNRRVSIENAYEIIRLRKEGQSLGKLAEKFGIKKQNISKIIKGTSYKFLSRD